MGAKSENIWVSGRRVVTGICFIIPGRRNDRNSHFEGGWENTSTAWSGGPVYPKNRVSQMGAFSSGRTLTNEILMMAFLVGLFWICFMIHWTPWRISEDEASPAESRTCTSISRAFLVTPKPAKDRWRVLEFFTACNPLMALLINGDKKIRFSKIPLGLC